MSEGEGKFLVIIDNETMAGYYKTLDDAKKYIKEKINIEKDMTCKIFKLVKSYKVEQTVKLVEE